MGEEILYLDPGKVLWSKLEGKGVFTVQVEGGTSVVHRNLLAPIALRPAESPRHHPVVQTLCVKSTSMLYAHQCIIH